MTHWYGLPQEIKQIIIRYVSNAESVIYVPRDRRLKVDRMYNKSNNFHDILLVSKVFSTADEFTLAILGIAKLTFGCYNELRRFMADVKPTVKQCVRRIHLRRAVIKYELDPVTDSFDGFSSIEKKFSATFPELQQIYISMPEYCADIGKYSRPLNLGPTEKENNATVEYTFDQENVQRLFSSNRGQKHCLTPPPV
ncbi:hypothetical protein H2198_000597 [Neophaeococcomyces mojaviensis]|uniref:Uncharacterized protein n=1 Tax=Neophaeococcomyces mojaviensis TaxID=3383035 RepID=A0ACC3AJB6_9EURO|nr:hypothetical protein H2198_000597 [Knufia sp. JES_112]